MAKSAIGPIVTINDRPTIDTIMDELAYADKRGINTLEFAINGEGLRIKINDTIWSPPMGKLTSEEW